MRGGMPRQHNGGGRPQGQGGNTASAPGATIRVNGPAAASDPK